MAEMRSYEHESDYGKVSEFLIRCHQPGNLDGNWLEPAWEYMHSHPMLDASNLGRIGIWEDGGEIVGVVHYESVLGEAFFEFHPNYRVLRSEMLDYAEGNLLGTDDKDGSKYLHVYVNDNDPDFAEEVRNRGYAKQDWGTRPLARYDIGTRIDQAAMPDGYRLQSLADDPNWAKVHGVLYRGFDHGEPTLTTEEDCEERRIMFETPTADLALKIVTIAPDGEFASICGIFYDKKNRYCYVEPVATDPKHRRKGLGAAAVLEGIRRCAERGAQIAYVGSDQAFYKAIGFDVIHVSECWAKRF